MGFWRDEVIETALDHETRKHIEEQRAWISREPQNARPYLHLAQLYRMQGKQDHALALLLEAVSLDAGLTPAHRALCEIYAVRGDYRAAWRHAREAQRQGDNEAAALLKRHGIAQPDQTEED
jgi:tetratricopeptide (TPR) repeat protein